MPYLPTGKYVSVSEFERWEVEQSKLVNEEEYDKTSWEVKIAKCRIRYAKLLSIFKGRSANYDDQAFVKCADEYGWKFAARYLKPVSTRAKREFGKTRL